MLPSRPALVRFSAKAHVVNAMAVGKTPRYTTHAIVSGFISPAASARPNANGAVTSVPTQQARWKALAVKQPGEDRDEDRPDIDEHRRRAGVDQLLPGVECHEVRAEPHNAGGCDQRPVATPHRKAGPPNADEDGEDKAGHQEAAKGERSGVEVVGHGADPDECGRPQQHGEQRRPSRQPVGGRGRGPRLGMGGHGVLGRCTVR